MVDAITIIALIVFTTVVGYAGELIFKKTKVPDVILLLLFGLAMSYLGFPREGIFRSIAPILSPLILLVILLDSGLKMEMRHVLSSFSRVISLGFFGLLFSMMAAAAIGITLMGLDIKMSLLIGAIFGGTSSVTVTTILRQAKAKESVKSLLSLESVFNDSITIMASIAMLSLIVPVVGFESPILTIFFAFGVGISTGVIYGLIWLILLNRSKGIQFDYMLTLAAAMLVYISSELFFVPGTGVIAVLFFGLSLGNATSFNRFIKRQYNLPNKIPLFHSEITFLMRAFFFVYLGLVASIQMNYLIYGIALTILLVIFRFGAVWLAMARSNIDGMELNLIRIMGPKGLVAASLTQLPVTYGIPGAEIIQNIAFVVIFSTTLFSAVATALISWRQTKE